MDNLFFYEKGREVPANAKREIDGGRLKGKTDINPMWRIKKLTELFGPCGIGWYYKSVKEWMEPYKDSVAAFVKIELYIKVEGEWSMPIQGTGGSMFVKLEKKDTSYVSDECFKMATTDAISVACKQLGIGADVYWDKDHTKYDLHQNQENAEDKRKRKDNASTKQDISEDKELISLRNQLVEECSRSGYSATAIEKTYKVENVHLLTKEQLKDAIGRLEKIPDRAAQ